MYTLVKFLHVSCALVSISGFALRGWLRLTGNTDMQGSRFRVWPHVIDSLLLASAVSLAFMSHQYPFATAWLTAKLLALCMYIVLGILTMRLRNGRMIRAITYVAALGTGAYIIAVAFSKSPLPL